MNIHDIDTQYIPMYYTRMVAEISRALMNTAQVVDLLNQVDDADTELDDCFFSGSDDKLGFEEVALEHRLQLSRNF